MYIQYSQTHPSIPFRGTTSTTSSTTKFLHQTAHLWFHLNQQNHVKNDEEETQPLGDKEDKNHLHQSDLVQVASLDSLASFLLTAEEVFNGIPSHSKKRTPSKHTLPFLRGIRRLRVKV